ncbi:hypothetical protein [Brevundimonas sp.]|uniref:hypothetical protein n=1 Tax=Brevundimonas sp. TaxID=1871086 RepID=UPI0035B4C900
MTTEAKTKPTDAAVDAFIEAVDHPGRREDARAALALLSEVTGEPPVMWGPSIIGFGRYHYRYESGREGDAPLVGFSPRKANTVFYMAAYDGAGGLSEPVGQAQVRSVVRLRQSPVGHRSGRPA